MNYEKILDLTRELDDKVADEHERSEEDMSKHEKSHMITVRHLITAIFDETYLARKAMWLAAARREEDHACEAIDTEEGMPRA